MCWRLGLVNNILLPTHQSFLSSLLVLKTGTCQQHTVADTPIIPQLTSCAEDWDLSTTSCCLHTNHSSAQFCKLSIKKTEKNQFRLWMQSSVANLMKKFEHRGGLGDKPGWWARDKPWWWARHKPWWWSRRQAVVVVSETSLGDGLETSRGGGLETSRGFGLDTSFGGGLETSRGGLGDEPWCWARDKLWWWAREKPLWWSPRQALVLG